MKGNPTRRRIIGLIGLLVLLGTTLMIRNRGGSDPSPPTEDPRIVAAPETRTYTAIDTIRRGDTLAGLLFRNRFDMQQIDRLLREIRSRSYFDPRRIRPGQFIELTRDEAGEIIQLSCHLSPEEAFVFEFSSGSDSLLSYPLEIETERRVRKLSGPVLSTFEEAILVAGGGIGLALQMSEIFSGDIDFFTEVRRGDGFSLLVEEKYVDDRFVGYGQILYAWYRGEEANAACAFYKSPEGKKGYYDMEGKSLRRQFLRSPLTYRRISSYFSTRRFHPILKKYRPHHGVDYAAPTGTPVSTVGDGVVTYAGWKSGLGKVVEIRHSPTHLTRYGHMSRIAEGIRKGKRVSQGDKIGYVGATGLATGPHLHYEMKVNGKPINPLRVKSAPADPIPSGQLAAYLERAEELADAESRLQPGALLEAEAWERTLLAHSLGTDGHAAVD